MRQGILSTVFVAAAAAAAAATVEKQSTSTTSQAPACTATASSGTGGFFDLRPDMAHPAEKGKPLKSGLSKDYRARGYDYGKNFTLNICGAVVDPVTDVMGVPKSSWANVSAYYISRGSIYSIGSESMDLVSRGNVRMLQYTDGSPCGGGTKSSKSSREASSLTSRHDDGGKELALSSRGPTVENLERADNGKENTTKRKSTTISFLCDRDPGNSRATISFVGVSPDECSYFFEARSIHACAHAEPHKPGSVGPGTVFSIILLVAILVYVLGGVFYNRTVANARGWRQLPNYSLWAGIWRFFSETFVALASSCLRCLPGRRGYSHLNANPRHRNSDAENRLIDQLDEEWDD